MAEFTNRAAYLKGLADGMKLNTETNEGKLLNEIIDFLGDLSDMVEALDDEQGFIADQVDELEEEVEMIGDEVFGDCDCCDCCCSEDDEFEVTCDECGQDIVVNLDDLEEGEILCPSCGEKIEFDIECDCDEECDC